VPISGKPEIGVPPFRMLWVLKKEEVVGTASSQPSPEQTNADHRSGATPQASTSTHLLSAD
jgi:hypothetical protein